MAILLPPLLKGRVRVGFLDGGNTLEEWCEHLNLITLLWGLLGKFNRMGFYILRFYQAAAVKQSALNKIPHLNTGPPKIMRNTSQAVSTSVEGTLAFEFTHPSIRAGFAAILLSSSWLQARKNRLRLLSKSSNRQRFRAWALVLWGVG